MTAIPSVNPSITGQGMNETARPSRSSPAARTMIPAMRLTITTAPGPWDATMGTRTTTMAPVGPETWTFDPPKTAAITPGDDRGDEPRLGGQSRADPEAQRERQRDDAHGEASEQIASPGAGCPTVVGCDRKQAAEIGAGAGRAPRRHRSGAHKAGPAGGQRPRVVEEFPIRLEHRHEQRTRDREQFRHRRISEPVVDVAGPALGLDEPVASEHGEVLRRCDASSSVSACRSATLTSGAAESSSRMRIRKGCARPLNRFALTS